MSLKTIIWGLFRISLGLFDILDLFENELGLLKIIFKTILGIFEKNFKPGYLKTILGLFDNKIIFGPICKIKLDLIKNKIRPILIILGLFENSFRSI